MTQSSTRHHPVRASVMAILALILAVTGVGVLRGGPAKADTPYGSITHVYMNVSSSGSPSQSSQYGGLITSLRRAVGAPYRDGVLRNQQIGFSLIRLTLSANSNSNLTLWITPNDLYVRGFTTNDNQTYEFGDTGLLNLMNSLGILPPGSGHTLAFNSDYNSMRQAAGRGRDAMPINYTSFWNSLFNLAYTTDPYGGNQVNIAQSLMLMVQLTSEAARFNDVFGVGSAIMSSSTINYSGLPVTQQYLENNWARISQFGVQASQDPSTPPVFINGIGTLHNWRDVARYLGMILLTFTLPQEGVSGDWSHTEL